MCLHKKICTKAKLKTVTRNNMREKNERPKEETKKQQQQKQLEYYQNASRLCRLEACQPGCQAASHNNIDIQTDRHTNIHCRQMDGRTDGTDRLKQTSQYPTKEKNKQATWNPCKTKQTTSGRVENNSRSSISFCFALELELVPIINALHGDKPSALCPRQERLFAFHRFYSRRRRTCNT